MQKSDLDLYLKMLKDPESKAGLMEMIKDFKLEAKIVIDFIQEAFSDDISDIMQVVRKTIVKETTKSFDLYIQAGFTREESISLIIGQGQIIKNAVANAQHLPKQ